MKTLNQFKVKTQTINIRIKVEQKVKAMYDAAQFEQRKLALEKDIAESKERHATLEIQIQGI